jgi:hypothetical protein
MASPNQEQRELTCSKILEIGVDNFFDFPLHVRLTTLVIPILTKNHIEIDLPILNTPVSSAMI